LVIVERAYYETTMCINFILIVDEFLTTVSFSQMLSVPLPYLYK